MLSLQQLASSLKMSMQSAAMRVPRHDAPPYAVSPRPILHSPCPPPKADLTLRRARQIAADHASDAYQFGRLVGNLGQIVQALRARGIEAGEPRAAAAAPAAAAGAAPAAAIASLGRDILRLAGQQEHIEEGLRAHGIGDPASAAAVAAALAGAARDVLNIAGEHERIGEALRAQRPAIGELAAALAAANVDTDSDSDSDSDSNSDSEPCSLQQIAAQTQQRAADAQVLSEDLAAAANAAASSCAPTEYSRRVSEIAALSQRHVAHAQALSDRAAALAAPNTTRAEVSGGLDEILAQVEEGQAMEEEISRMRGELREHQRLSRGGGGPAA